MMKTIALLLCFSLFACSEASFSDEKKLVGCEDLGRLFDIFSSADVFKKTPSEFFKGTENLFSVEKDITATSEFDTTTQIINVSQKNGRWLKSGEFMYDIQSGKVIFSNAEFELNSDCFSGHEDFYSLAKKHLGKSEYDMPLDPELGLDQEWHHPSGDIDTWWVVQIQAFENEAFLKVSVTPAPTNESDE